MALGRSNLHSLPLQGVYYIVFAQLKKAMNRLAGFGDGAPAPQTRREKELHATKELLAKSNDLLREVDESHIMKENLARQYPKFDRSELKIGPLLGVGGFAIVFEVKDFHLRLPDEVEVLQPMEELQDTQNSAPSSGSLSSRSHQDLTLNERRTVSEQTAVSTNCEESQTTDTTVVNTSELDLPTAISHGDVLPVHDDSHYDIRSARSQMAENVRRNGEARYAIKRLHRDLSDLERVRGMIDLAIEVKFLSVLWHPNIGKFQLSWFFHDASLPVVSPTMKLMFVECFIPISRSLLLSSLTQ